MPVVTGVASVAVTDHWVDESNAFADNLAFAYVEPEANPSSYLLLRGFGFSIPACATIGDVRIERLDSSVAAYYGAAAPTFTLSVTTDGGTSHTGSIVINAERSASPSSPAIPLNGLGLTAAALSTALFGIRLVPTGGLTDSDPDTIQFRVQFLRVQVTYTPATALGTSTLSGTAGDAENLVSWTSVPSATSYQLRRATSPGGPYSTVYTGTDLSYTDTGLVNGTTYYYVVNATDGCQTTTSAEFSLTPMGTPIPAPGDTVVTGVIGLCRISLSWSIAANASSYSVQRSTEGCSSGFTEIGTTTSTHYVDTTATRGTPYYYKVVPTNAEGTGTSNCVALTMLTCTGGRLRWAPPISQEDLETGGICDVSGYWFPGRMLTTDSRGRVGIPFRVQNNHAD